MSHDVVAFSLILVLRGVGASFNLKLQFVCLRTHINCDLMERYKYSYPSCPKPQRQGNFTNERYFIFWSSLIVPEKEWPMTKQYCFREYGCEAVDGRSVFVIYTSIKSV